MTAAQAALLTRLRDLLADEPFLREVAMFGGRCLMVNEKLLVSASKNGGLLVRVPAERHDELLARPGAKQAEMGTGRTMGPGWIEVAPEALADQQGLAAWVGVALEYNRAIAAGDPE